MAEIKIDVVVYHLDGEFRKALDDTMAEFAPAVPVDIAAAFEYFQQHVYSSCSAWEKVPDACIRGGDK